MEMFLIFKKRINDMVLLHVFLVPNIWKANSEIKNYKQNHVKFNVHHAKMELQHYSLKRPNPAYVLYLVSCFMPCVYSCGRVRMAIYRYYNFPFAVLT